MWTLEMTPPPEGGGRSVVGRALHRERCRQQVQVPVVFVSRNVRIALRVSVLRTQREPTTEFVSGAQTQATDVIVTTEVLVLVLLVAKVHLGVQVATPAVVPDDAGRGTQDEAAQAG